MRSRERTNNMQNLHVNGVKKPVPFYTLNVIISVGKRDVLMSPFSKKHGKAFGESIKCTKFVARTKARMYEIKQYRGF